MLDFASDNGIQVHAVINNYNAAIIDDEKCGCYLKGGDYETDVKSTPDFATIQIINDNGQYKLVCTLTPLVYSDFGINGFTLTPYLKLKNTTACDDSIAGTPYNYLP